MTTSLTHTGSSVGNHLALGNNIVNTAITSHQRYSTNPFQSSAILQIIPETSPTARETNPIYSVRIDVLLTNTSSLSQEIQSLSLDFSKVLIPSSSAADVKINLSVPNDAVPSGQTVTLLLLTSPVFTPNATLSLTISADYRTINPQCLCLTKADCPIPYKVVAANNADGSFGPSVTYSGTISYVTAPALSFSGSACQRLSNQRFQYHLVLKNIWLNPITKLVLSFRDAVALTIVGTPPGWSVANNQMVYDLLYPSGTTLQVTVLVEKVVLNTTSNIIDYIATSIIGCDYRGAGYLPACRS